LLETEEHIVSKGESKREPGTNDGLSIDTIEFGYAVVAENG